MFLSGFFPFLPVRKKKMKYHKNHEEKIVPSDKNFNAVKVVQGSKPNFSSTFDIFFYF